MVSVFLGWCFPCSMSELIYGIAHPRVSIYTLIRHGPRVTHITDESVTLTIAFRKKSRTTGTNPHRDAVNLAVFAVVLRISCSLHGLFGHRRQSDKPSGRNPSPPKRNNWLCVVQNCLCHCCHLFTAAIPTADEALFNSRYCTRLVSVYRRLMGTWPTTIIPFLQIWMLRKRF